VLVVLGRVEQILRLARTVDRQISRASSPALLPALADVRAQLQGLVHRGFVTETGVRRLPDLVRYLRGIEQRMDKAALNVARDRQATYTIQTLTEEYQHRLAAVPAGRQPPPELAEVRWMLEELRVSLFAQTLGTPYPVSDKRIRKALSTVGTTH
jgi:ATP-dependent helicase HrpA